MKKKLPILTASILLASCDSVQLQYEPPAPSGDFAAIERQADDHFEYFAFSRTYILVSSEEQKSAAPAAASTDAQGATQKGAGKKQGSDNQGAAATPATGASEATGGPTASTAPPSEPLQSAVIEGKKWTARVVPIPSEVGIEVKGVSGFWRNTTLGVSRYQNSDIVNSVSSKAENLVPKRVGQIAGAVASIVQIAKVLAVAGEPPVTLTPFSVPVPDEDTAQPLDIPSTQAESDYKNQYWQYEWKYDSPNPPAGTVSIDDFLKGVQGRKVGYWPVPACRSGTLTLLRTGTGARYSFHVVVSSLRYVRLQPLSVDGKTDLGSVCSASTSGATSADSVTAFSDDLTALQQAVRTVKGAGAANAGGASDADASGGKKAGKQ